MRHDDPPKIPPDNEFPNSEGSETEGYDTGMDKANLAATPGSTRGGTLAGTPDLLSGATPGSEPQSPGQDVPPRTAVTATPEGASAEGITGSTTGGDSGSTAESPVGSTTGNRRALKPEDLLSHPKHPDEAS